MPRIATAGRLQKNIRDSVNLSCWLRADAVEISGGVVRGMKDLGPEGNHFNILKGVVPTYNATNAPNSKPALTWAGTGAFRSARLAALSTAATIIIVSKATTIAGTFRVPFTLGDHSSGGLGYVINGNATLRREIYMPGVVFDLRALATTNWEVVTIRSATAWATPTNGIGEMRVNGVVETPSAFSGQPLPASTRMSIGSSYVPGGDSLTGSFIGDIAEVLVWRARLNDASVSEVEEYLRGYYAGIY